MKQNFLLLLLCIAITTSGQVYTNKDVGKKNQVKTDTVKKQEYPYILPIWGKKTTEKGFQLPYSAGISVNYFWQESDLIIDNLNVGFNNGEMYNLDEIIRFNSAVAEASAINVRPDFWLFPFLNIYGLFGMGKTSTTIDAGVWLPDTSGQWNEITAFSTKANFDVTMLGFGMTPTFGIKGIWMAFDMNWAWTDVNALDKPVFTFVFGPRVGTTIKFKKPNMNIAFWAGGFRVKFTSETSGSINLSEVINLDDAQAKVDDGIIKVEDAASQVDAWWNGLSSAEQMNPVNIAKHDIATKAVDGAGNILAAADGALTTAETSTVQYTLDKDVKDKWNFVIGSQYQINRHFMIRAECGFLASRTQFIGGLQYRFGL